MRIKTTLVAACAAALLVPAAAQAATLGVEGDTLVYRADPGQGTNLLLTSYSDWDTGTKFLSFYDSAISEEQVSIQTGLCQNHQYGGIICDLDPNRPIRIEGSSVRDNISIFSASDVPNSIPVTINGNDGDDKIQDAYDSPTGRTFTGGGGNDEIDGYAGNDTLDGGEGTDTLDGGENNDRVLGGGGDDEVAGDGYKSPGSDVIDGGAGNDLISEWSIPENLDRQPAVNVTLDGVANDGRPGENDNVVGVEQLDMYVVGSITGSDAAEKIVLVNPGNKGSSTLVGNGGNDELVGYDYDDTIDGGTGDDRVEGGMGNDTVTGGSGKDTIYGDATRSYCSWYSCKIPFGNDVINARDGEVDNVDCGIGEDRAIVDSVDVVVNCENVDGAGPGGGNAGGAAGGAGGGAGGGGKLSFAVAGTKLKSVARNGLKFKVACSSACSVAGTLQKGSRKLGSGRAKAAKAGTVTATVKLTKKGKRAIKGAKKVKATLTVTVTPKGGAPVSATRKLTLKR